MRIVYHHRTSGTDAQRIHILEIVKALRSLGHEVDIVGLVDPETAQSDPKRDAEEAGWKKVLRRIPYAWEAAQLGYNLVGIPLVLSGVFRRRADFVYERYALFNFSGVFVARLLRIPIVLEVNSPTSIEMKRDGHIRNLKFAVWTERVICNSATSVVVVSSPLRKIMSGLGVKEEKMVVMTNGINLNEFRYDAGSGGELRLRLHLEGRTVIGFVGWFRNWHGLDLLLKAFHRAELGSRNFRLLLIGDGPEMPALQAYVKSNQLEDLVLFTGPLVHTEVPPYIGLIDIAVQPAANEYCCPMKILEYMAMGKPIVAPRQENIEELIDEGVQGCLFQPGDVDSMAAALSRMAADPATARRMGEKARATISERGYLWTSNAHRVIDLISRAAR